MSAEINLFERNQELERELLAAMELIKRYEVKLAEVESQNSTFLKKSIHDLSNPLQILAMTIESLQMKAGDDLQPTLERMRRSAEVMTTILISMRRLRASTTTVETKTEQVV